MANRKLVSIAALAVITAGALVVAFKAGAMHAATPPHFEVVIPTAVGLSVTDEDPRNYFPDPSKVPFPYFGKGPLVDGIAIGSLAAEASVPGRTMDGFVWLEAVNGVATPDAWTAAKALAVPGPITVVISDQAGIHATWSIRPPLGLMHAERAASSIKN